MLFRSRQNMALAALLSGITLTSAGLGAVHGLAAPLGANFPVPHGVVCAALLPHVISANTRALRDGSAGGPALERYATIGRVLAGDERLPRDVAIERAAGETAALTRDLNIPALSSFGLTRGEIPEMVSLARKASSMRYNPATLSDAALTGVLSDAG